MRTPATVVLTLAALGLAVAGCTDDSTVTGSSPAPSTPAASRAAGGPVAGCVTGSWRSTAVGEQASSGTARASLSGGSGVMVTIGGNGETIVDFTRMQPVDFTSKVGGTEVSGHFIFAGQVSGTVQTGATSSASPTASPTEPPSPTATPPSPTPSGPATPPSSTATPPTPTASPGETGTGSWEPVPPVDWGNTRVTVDLVKPMKARPVDNVRIADYVGTGADQTGGVVDIEPLLGKGSYRCQGDSLVLTPEDGGMAWTLTRA